MDKIVVRGARSHNLKNIDCEIPKNKLTVITGLSGSGKSSLAFDTLYAEGQRRYVESLSAYARQFLSMMEKPDVDYIGGLSPAIAIEQKTASHNPRSTVGTITEIYDYLRLLFARVGVPRCPEHGQPLERQSISQIVDQILALSGSPKVMLLSPIIRDKKGEHESIFSNLRRQGFIRVRVDGHVVDLDSVPSLEKNKKHTIEVVVDRLRVTSENQGRLAESIELSLSMSQGLVVVDFMEATSHKAMLFSSEFACVYCGYSLEALEPRLFSFNNPAGACSECNGLGIKEYFDSEKIVYCQELTLEEGALLGWNRGNIYYFHMLRSLAMHYGFNLDVPFKNLPNLIKEVLFYGSGEEEIVFDYISDRGVTLKRKHVFEGIVHNLERRYRETDSSLKREALSKYVSQKSCPFCQGSRLCQEARHVFVEEYTLSDIVRIPVGRLYTNLKALVLTGKRGKIAEKILKEIHGRLNFLVNVGLEYLTLERSAHTLSGGEAQRIRLASQIGTGLTGVMYVLDEPSIGLHQRDNNRLLETLFNLRDLGNTVIVVEHDEEAICSADYVLDIGPGAGQHGGDIIFAGTPEQLKMSEMSITGQYLSGKRVIPIPQERRLCTENKALIIEGCSGNNLKNIAFKVPVGVTTCVTGVSGSGKSTLVNGTLYPILASALNGATVLSPQAYDTINGIEHFDKCINIDQSPIGRTPRSNSATYTGIFTFVRELFSGVEQARIRGYKPGRFSFNVKGGRCESCQGDGVVKVAMHFLPDIYVTCDICKGKRYNRETLEIFYKGKNIADILEMTVEEATDFFDAIPILKGKLDTLMQVGLSYIQLGQSAVTLSGGEAQRIKLAKELSKRSTGKTFYVLDEPTTGLHFEDIKQLLWVLNCLCDAGNTVVIVEHNLDVIKTADWIIDLGPEGGELGGAIIAEGTPEDVAKVQASYTGQFLQSTLAVNREKKHG